jgi:hypothetical protein
LPTSGPATTVVPLPGRPLLNLGQYDLAALSFVVEEDLLSGVATSYQSVDEQTEDGQWKAAPAGRSPFITRLVVVRPSDPAKLNGTVVVEWLNVTGGGDWAPSWSAVHRVFLRKGFAWVGVSVQKLGIEGTATFGFGSLKPLKVLDPKWYADLPHPGDAFAYDIYSQAGRAVRGVDGTNLLGPLKVKRVLASAESQSASYLTTYVNAIDPSVKVYDGFLIHSRNRTSAEIEGTYVGAPNRKIPKVVRFRNDLRVPVLCPVTELDLTNFFPATLSGLGKSGPRVAILIGTPEPFDSAKLTPLYPGGKIEYLKGFGTSLQQSIDAGFILSDDASEILRLAEIMYPSNAPGQ